MAKTLQLLIALCCFLFVLFSAYSKLFVKVIFFISACLWLVIILIEWITPQPKTAKFFLNFMPPNPLNIFILIFLSSAVLSTIFSLNFMHSQQVFFERYILYVFCFICGSFVAYSKKYLKNLIILFAISGSILGIGGMWDYFRSLNPRLFTTFGWPVDFSVYLGFYIPLSCALAFFSKNKFLRIIGWVNICLLLPCLLWNASRALWLAVPIAVLFIALLKNKKVFLVLAIIISLGVSFLSPVYKKRASTTFDVSTWNRIDIYKYAFKIFKDYPVSGAGVGMCEKLLGQYARPQGFLDGDKHIHAHNTYLEVMAEMGLIGFFSFIMIFVVFFIKLFRNISIWKQLLPDEQAIFLGVSGAVITTLITAYAATIITVGIPDSTTFWFLLGISSGLLFQNKVMQPELQETK